MCVCVFEIRVMRCVSQYVVWRLVCPSARNFYFAIHVGRGQGWAQLRKCVASNTTCVLALNEHF